MTRLVEIGPVLLENNSKFRRYILAILLLSQLGKGHGPSFDYIRFHSHYPRMLCAKFG